MLDNDFMCINPIKDVIIKTLADIYSLDKKAVMTEL